MLDHPDALWQTGIMTNEAIHTVSSKMKPVHINFPFREPLYNTAPNNIRKARKVSLTKVSENIQIDELKKNYKLRKMIEHLSKGRSF